jgi:hypothetical protein
LKLLEPRSIVTALVLIVVVVFAGVTSLVTVHASSPTISSVTVSNQATSLTLASGGQIYIYAVTTDGSAQTSYFAHSLSYLEAPFSIKNADGHYGAAVALSTSNTNSYTTSAKSYTIAGASVSGFGAIPGGVRPIAYAGISAAPGANGVSAWAYVPGPPHYPATGYLVVVVAVGGDEQCISVSGISGLVIDASNSNSGNPAIIIGHVYASGNVGYVVTMVSSQCAAGVQNPSQAADLLMVFVFLPT